MFFPEEMNGKPMKNRIHFQFSHTIGKYYCEGNEAQ